MRTIARLIVLVFHLGVAHTGVCQDIVITNARILNGAGGTVELGSLLVRDGRIVSVSSGTVDAPDVAEIDANGMTVVPGLIDTHMHLLTYSFARSQQALETWIDTTLPEQLEQILAAGVTTVSNNGDFYPAVIDVRARLESGELVGPRMLVAGPVFTAPDGHPAMTQVCRGDTFCRESMAVEVDDPDVARGRVRELADSHVDAIKAVYHQPGMPSLDDGVLRAVAEEAEAHGLPLIVHDQSFSGMLTAAALGADRFAHTPYVDAVDPAEAKRILADAGIPVSTTLAGVFRELKPMNLKTLGEAGVNLALGTDVPLFVGYENNLSRELLALAELFSEEQVLAMVTRNAAAYLGLDDEVGTLEPGKQADIVVVDGDPLDDISNLANVVAVIRGGRLIVDTR